MLDIEYRILQRRFSAKLKSNRGYSTNKETAYNEGVLACKSILKEIFERQKEEKEGGDVNELET